MNLSEIDYLLCSYTEDELFYKDYYEAKKDEEAYKIFIDNIDLEFIKNNRILVSEVEAYPDLLTEETSFSANNLNDIIIQKHNRYSPAFSHKHVFFEMIYVYSGSCKNEINNEILEMNMGDICIISPLINHSLHVFDDSIVITILIRKSTFNDTFFQILTDNNILSIYFTKILHTKTHNNYIIFQTNGDERLKNILLEMLNENLETKKYCDKILDNMMMMFFGYLLRSYENKVILPTEMRNDSEKSTKILNYIQDNYLDITLDKVAHNFNFSLPYVSKLIKNTTSKNFTEIIQKIKMDKACKILVTTNFSIIDICEMVGYANQEHFIRIFKKNFEISPSKYRKKYS